MRILGRLTTIPDDLPVPDGTQGQIRRLIDDVLVATVETTDGWYFYEQNGSPGPFRIFWDYANVVSNQYSKITGPSAATDIASLPLLFRAWRDGVVPDIGGEMAASSTGTNMTVAIATGAAVVKGILYDQNAASNVTIGTADATNDRIDTIAIQIVPAGSGEDVEGRAELVVVAGTPAASPVAPALTQTNDLWEHPIADVLVGSGVTAIGSDKVTDRRTFSGNEVDDGSVTTEKLADGAVTTAKIDDGAVTDDKIGSFAGRLVGADSAVDRLGGSGTAIINGTYSYAPVTVSGLDSAKTYRYVMQGWSLFRRDDTGSQVILVGFIINGAEQGEANCYLTQDESAGATRFATGTFTGRTSCDGELQVEVFDDHQIFDAVTMLQVFEA